MACHAFRWLRFVSIGICLGVFAAKLAEAQQLGGKFVPSESEWAVWPSYCQARYVDLPLGQTTKFADRMSAAQISAIRATLRPQTYHPIHHYCFAIGYMLRARKTSPVTESTIYEFFLRSVVNEGQYTIRRMDLTDPIAAEVAYLMATALSLLGDSANGIDLLQEVITAQPQLPGGYVALTLLYRSQKSTRQSIETLKLAFERVLEPSASLYHTAATVYFENDELEVAQGYAVKAYELGYPLPGLKRKLADRGYWPANVIDSEVE